MAEPFVAILLGIFGGVAGAAIAAFATGADLEDDSLAVIAGSLLGVWAMYVLVVVPTARVKGANGVLRDLGLKAPLRDAGVGFAFGLAARFALVPLIYEVIDATGLLRDDQLDRLGEPAERIADLAEGPSFLLLVLFVGIGAPIFEEILFRGFLQPAAIRRLGPALGIGLTSLVFGAVHLQLLQFPGLAAFGAVLGFVAYRTNALLAPITAHMLFNIVTLVVLAASR